MTISIDDLPLAANLGENDIVPINRNHVTQKARFGDIRDLIQGDIAGSILSDAKAVAEETTKETVEEIVKGAAIETVKEMTRETVEGMVAEVVGDTAREAVEEIVKETVEGIARETVEEIARGTAEEVSGGALEQAVKRGEMGKPGGVAELDAAGKVPPGQTYESPGIYYTGTHLNKTVGGSVPSVNPNAPAGKTARVGDIVVSTGNMVLGSITAVSSQTSVTVTTRCDLNAIHEDFEYIGVFGKDSRAIVLGHGAPDGAAYLFENSVIIGAGALKSVSMPGASRNSVYIGRAAGMYGSGSHNTVIGEEAFKHSKGDANVAVGNGAGSYINGDKNTFVGGSRPPFDISINDCTALGSGSGALFENGYSERVQLGGSKATVYIRSAPVTTSDGRDKADIRPTELGLGFIEALRPVDYRWDCRCDYVEHGFDEETGMPCEDKKERDGSKKRGRFHHGFIAQDIQGLIAETGKDFGGFLNSGVNESGDELSLRYEEMIAPMVKAIQELSAQNKALEKRINELEGRK
jgi:hypothetical protein